MKHTNMTGILNKIYLFHIYLFYHFDQLKKIIYPSKIHKNI